MTTAALPTFREVLTRLADDIDGNWSGAVDGADPERLHDLRVAVRRTRSVLSQGKRVLPRDIRARYRAEFGWLGVETGPARDLDVYVEEWSTYTTPLPAVSAAALDPVLMHLTGLRDKARAALAVTLQSERYHELRTTWRSWLAEPASGGGSEADEPALAIVGDRIDDAYEQLVTRGRRIGTDSPAGELHDLRKDGKKLRYLLECFGDLLPPGPRKDLVTQLKALQDNLGQHQDAEVHAARLLDLASTTAFDGSTASAIRELVTSIDDRRQAARDEFATRFAAFDTAETRVAVARMLPEQHFETART